ncbi:phospholipase D family protein [Streptomyces sp. NPDC004647]|uniref:phospholipase D family protein n=1 Tax=Streptomyces sp. NPDC004647 TaxID=3154671 RepID=UPI0033BA0932
MAALNPLVDALQRAQNPSGACHDLSARATDGGDLIAALAACAPPAAEFANEVLEHAGVVDSGGKPTPDAVVRLAQTQVLLAERAAATTAALAVTVPAYLRADIPVGRFTETAPVLRAIAQSAQHRLFIAAPYLHPGFIETLAPAIEALARRGGTTVVITRALSTIAGPAAANTAAIALLRDRLADAGGTLSVCSWEEEGLGMHFKCVAADRTSAYIGSANLTWGGTDAHAEAGVILHGPEVARLVEWLEAVAEALRDRRRPRGR